MINFKELINNLISLVEEIDEKFWENLREDVPAIIHPNDKEIFNFLNIGEHRAFIAGGAALAWYQGTPVEQRDIDIWFESPKDLLKMREFLNSSNSSVCMQTFHSADAETWTIDLYRLHKKYRVQLITNYFSSDPYSIINRFDITVCQILTNGERWWHTGDFIQDLHNRVLRMNHTHQKSLKRLLKYWTYGFEPDQATLENILNNTELTWEYSDDDGNDYDGTI